MHGLRNNTLVDLGPGLAKFIACLACFIRSGLGARSSKNIVHYNIWVWRSQASLTEVQTRERVESSLVVGGTRIEPWCSLWFMKYALWLALSLEIKVEARVVAIPHRGDSCRVLGHLECQHESAALLLFLPMVENWIFPTNIKYPLDWCAVCVVFDVVTSSGKSIVVTSSLNCVGELPFCSALK